MENTNLVTEIRRTEHSRVRIYSDCVLPSRGAQELAIRQAWEIADQIAERVARERYERMNNHDTGKGNHAGG